MCVCSKFNIENLEHFRIFTYGGDPTGSRLESRADSGGPLSGSLNGQIVLQNQTLRSIPELKSPSPITAVLSTYTSPRNTYVHTSTDNRVTDLNKKRHAFHSLNLYTCNANSYPFVPTYHLPKLTIQSSSNSRLTKLRLRCLDV